MRLFWGQKHVKLPTHADPNVSLKEYWAIHSRNCLLMLELLIFLIAFLGIERWKLGTEHFCWEFTRTAADSKWLPEGRAAKW